MSRGRNLLQKPLKSRKNIEFMITCNNYQPIRIGYARCCSRNLAIENDPIVSLVLATLVKLWNATRQKKTCSQKYIGEIPKWQKYEWFSFLNSGRMWQPNESCPEPANRTASLSDMCHWQLCCNRYRPLEVPPASISTNQYQHNWMVQTKQSGPCIWFSAQSLQIWSRPTSPSPPSVPPRRPLPFPGGRNATPNPKVTVNRRPQRPRQCRWKPCWASTMLQSSHSGV